MINSILQFWGKSGLKWLGGHSTEKIQTLPEDSSIRAGLGLSLKSEFMKQEVSSICPECDADEENMCYMGEIENN